MPFPRGADNGRVVVPASLSQRVAAILREAAAEVILPRFQRLQAHEISEKTPGETVTIADQEAELAITPQLEALIPGSRVVGEEAVNAAPALLEGLGEGLVWLLDPVDGTSNFVRGSASFAVMAALMRDGVAVASWILAPVSDSLAAAELGGGALSDGQRLRVAERDATAANLRAALHTRYMPAAVRAAVEQTAPVFADHTGGVSCAGVEYRELVAGVHDVSLYWRTLPWDHVPGALLLSEAGGHAARPDGTPYRAGDNRTGLLAAITPAAWESARAELHAAFV